MDTPDYTEWLYDLKNEVRIGMNTIRVTFPKLPETPNRFCTGVVANVVLVSFKYAKRIPTQKVEFEELGFSGDWSPNDGNS